MTDKISTDEVAILRGGEFYITKADATLSGWKAESKTTGTARVWIYATAKYPAAPEVLIASFDLQGGATVYDSPTLAVFPAGSEISLKTEEAANVVVSDGEDDTRTTVEFTLRPVVEALAVE